VKKKDSHSYSPDSEEDEDESIRDDEEITQKETVPSK